MTKILLTIIVLLCNSVIFAEEFHQDFLHTVWGKKNWTGIKDCSASVDLISFNNKIIIEVHVTDDYLYFSDDPIHSDHIEIWFAIPEVYESFNSDSYYDPPYSNEYIVSEKNLYLYKNKADLDSFLIEIESPVIETHNYGKKYLDYKKLKNHEYEMTDDYLIKDIDEYLFDACFSYLTKKYVFYGITHLGIMQNPYKCVLYDKENYSVLESQTNSKLADLSKYVKIIPKRFKSGYGALIQIKPEALGFIKNSGVQNISFMIDIVDVDEKHVQETLLSSSIKRKWGNPNSFNKLKLNKNIDVKLNKSLKALGNSNTENKADVKIRNTFPSIFWFTKEGWMPIYRKIEQFFEYDQPSTFLLPNIEKCSFIQSETCYEKKLLGKNILEYYTICEKEYLIVNNNLVLPTNELVFTFLLPDNSVGIITSDFSIGGGYNRQIQSILKLITEKSSIVIAQFNQPDFHIADSIYIESSEVDYNIVDRAIYNKDSENISWKHLVSWDKQGSSIILNMGKDSVFKISWDEQGQNIQVKQAFE